MRKPLRQYTYAQKAVEYKIVIRPGLFVLILLDIYLLIRRE